MSNKTSTQSKARSSQPTWLGKCFRVRCCPTSNSNPWLSSRKNRHQQSKSSPSHPRNHPHKKSNNSTTKTCNKCTPQDLRLFSNLWARPRSIFQFWLILLLRLGGIRKNSHQFIGDQLSIRAWANLRMSGAGMSYCSWSRPSTGNSLADILR